MKEIISSILLAESKATEIIASANEEAKSIIMEAEKNSDAVMEQAVTDFKSFRKAEVSKAEAEAEFLYEQKILEGKANAESLKKSLFDKIDVVSEEVLKNILG